MCFDSFIKEIVLKVAMNLQSGIEVILLFE